MMPVIWREIKKILAVGVPYAGQMMVVNLSYVILTGMINAYGITVAAAAGIGLKISTLAAMPCWAVGTAVTAMVAQNMGAGNPGRVRGVLYTGLAAGFTVTGCMVVPMLIRVLFVTRGQWA